MKLSSTKRGNNFEERVYHFLKKELEEGKLLVNPMTSTIFKKKAYYSKDRDSHIITDLSVEVSYDGSGNIGLLMVIECKDYSHPVPVDDIEEFYSKVIQISGLNVKAIFVTTAALQKSAYQYAMSKKIAVIRLLPEDQVIHALYAVMPTLPKWLFLQMIQFKQFKGPMFEQDFTTETFQFFGIVDHSDNASHWIFAPFYKKLVGKA